MDAKVDCHGSCLETGRGEGGGGGEVRLTTQKTVRILQIKFFLFRGKKGNSGAQYVCFPDFRTKLQNYSFHRWRVVDKL